MLAIVRSIIAPSDRVKNIHLGCEIQKEVGANWLRVESASVAYRVSQGVLAQNFLVKRIDIDNLDLALSCIQARSELAEHCAHALRSKGLNR